MWINNDLEEYLSQSASNNSCRVILTDLSKIIFSNQRDYIQQSISKELLRLLLDFSLSSPSRQVVDSATSIIPILEDTELTVEGCRQIIMPIYYKETLSGLIITLFNGTSNGNALESSKIMRMFTEEMLHGFKKQNIATLADETILFSEDNVTRVNDLVESKISILKKQEGYILKKESLSNNVEIFEKTLTQEQQKIFDNILEKVYEINDFEKTLAYSIGIKYGNELSKV